ncbi:glycosyltransferase family 2 protein [Mesorhizobium sp. ZMM04-5]|uniref:Glycosyltransferase family 2 protein n=1 Tax=Mesorhizobium marinum TaxID=3228790 RepID=A0ABV3R2D0_9HYPH
MLTVVIETKDDEEGLARTLASLVPGAVEGVVREVIVCDVGSTDQTHYVAEHAGCNYVAGGAADGIAKARGEWLLLLEPGARLLEGWADSVIAHAARMTMPARFSRSRASRQPFLSRAFSRPTALAEGLVITRRQATALCKSAKTAEAIARGLATKRLDGEIVVAPTGKA